MKSRSGTAPDTVSDDGVKVHTLRREDGDPLVDAAILQRTIGRLRKAPLVPRGLYRFSSHEEAEEWMVRQMAALHARQNWKT